MLPPPRGLLHPAHSSERGYPKPHPQRHLLCLTSDLQRDPRHVAEPLSRPPTVAPPRPAALSRARAPRPPRAPGQLRPPQPSAKDAPFLPRLWDGRLAALWTPGPAPAASVGRGLRHPPAGRPRLTLKSAPPCPPLWSGSDSRGGVVTIFCRSTSQGWGRRRPSSRWCDPCPLFRSSSVRAMTRGRPRGHPRPDLTLALIWDGRETRPSNVFALPLPCYYSLSARLPSCSDLAAAPTDGALVRFARAREPLGFHRAPASDGRRHAGRRRIVRWERDG